MTDADRVASLATISGRIEALGERLALCHVPVGHLGELAQIQKAVMFLIMSFAPEAKK